MKYISFIRGPEGLQPPAACSRRWTGSSKMRPKPSAGDDGRPWSDLGRPQSAPVGGQAEVTDGPFTEAKEVIGGYAVDDVASRDELMKWTMRDMDLHRHRPDGGRVRSTRDAGGRPGDGLTTGAADQGPSRLLHFGADGGVIGSHGGRQYHATIDAIWRIESPRLIGGLAPGERRRARRGAGPGRARHRAGKVAGRRSPHNPGAWLMATAKRRAIDKLRRDQMLIRKHRNCP